MEVAMFRIYLKDKIKNYVIRQKTSVINIVKSYRIAEMTVGWKYM